MERDELEACLYGLGRAMRNIRYAQEFGKEYEKEHIAELKIDEAEIKAVLGILSDSRCHIALFEEKCYRQDDGTWWRRKYELPGYCAGDTIYYAELTVSLLVDGTGGHVELRKGDVTLDLRRIPEDENPGDDAEKLTDAPNVRLEHKNLSTEEQTRDILKQFGLSDKPPEDNSE